MSANQLPPKSSLQDQKDEFKFRTALDAPHYLQLDKEAMSRGLRPFRFAKLLLTAYLDGQLLYLSELPVAIQAQIQQHQAVQTKAND